MPVLADAVVEWLRPRAGGVYVDATVGSGGHAERVLEASSPSGRLVGVDRDPQALQAARERLARFGDRVELVRGNFAHLPQLLASLGIREVDGVLFDLGVSSLQLQQAERGFSFHLPGPLDMRMDPDQAQTAADLVNSLPEQALAEILWRYGQEPFARRIARCMVRRRPLRTTTELVEAVKSAVPRSRWPRRLHVATRTFQALRIATNRELECLEKVLAALPTLVRPGGRAVVISFHSLEDRLVKQAFHLDLRWRPLVRTPVRPSPEEIRQNPRARSARLRAAERAEA